MRWLSVEMALVVSVRGLSNVATRLSCLECCELNGGEIADVLFVARHVVNVRDRQGRTTRSKGSEYMRRCELDQ